MSFLKKLIGIGTWGSVSEDITESLCQRLNKESFGNFTALCKKYKLFNQISKIGNMSEDPGGVGGGPLRPIEERLVLLVCFLSNVGNELDKQSILQHGSQRILQHGSQLMKDGIEFSKIALALKPDHFPARTDLAFSYSMMGLTLEAQEEAKQAILDMDKDNANRKLNPLPQVLKELLKELLPSDSDEDTRQLRAKLQKIAEGKPWILCVLPK